MYGNSPGHSLSSVPYAGSTSTPDSVVKSASRTRDRSYTFLSCVLPGTDSHTAAIRTFRGLAPGPVRQPNHVRCVRTMGFKLSRYFDPSGAAPQEWEMYDLRNDPNEVVNLVQVRGTPPTARDDLPDWTTREAVQQEADSLATLLAELEARDLS